MNILLFGVPCVGKSAIGKELALRMQVPFFDQKEEMEKLHGKTAFEISRGTFGDAYDRIKKDTMAHIFAAHPEDKVIAVQPLYYYTMIRPFVQRPDTFSVVLEDTPEHIFERLIITDWNDQPADVPDWKQANRKPLIREIKKDITYFKNVHKHIPRKYNVDSKPPEVCAEELQQLIEAENGAASAVCVRFQY